MRIVASSQEFLLMALNDELNGVENWSDKPPMHVGKYDLGDCFRDLGKM